ncbi:c-type cytochrome [Opitutus terrae]|uniref:Cytochrome c class I n=1 Tax=Opitutus terrae (strain DSM 11246 / JCM 15787 / PB90-1) TaxID=452637 RepID=B1ZTY5_OPITP|nr:cytochrome c [Opitutus terrae]ACB75867.1 cytochrome c class I [Opitutus terrae PB90-1]
MKNCTKLALATVSFLVGAAISQAAPAAENWENHCQKCHGATGKADTKTGKKLKIRDYSDAAVQGQLKDDEMLKAIADGVKNDAGKEVMKGYKDELSQEEMSDLVTFIRKLKA